MAAPESALPDYEPHDPGIFEETDLDAEIQALHLERQQRQQQPQQQQQQVKEHHHKFKVDDIEEDENDDMPKWKRNLQSLGCVATSPKSSPARNSSNKSSAATSPSTSAPDPFQEEEGEEDIRKQIEEEAMDSGCLGRRGRRKKQEESQERRGSSQWDFSFQAAQQQLSTVEELQDESSVMSRLSSAPPSVAGGSYHAHKDPLALGKSKVPPVPEEILSPSPVAARKSTSGSKD
mmetsp:Transcript_372/g.682  ORF Transcript_372/g.682 Transcript_372/m.682 type:complete len:234 (-) Transcript_372:33-734(-)|eukprot:CAMPEP_0168752962 /NCGR_PEP_ID=MMETSP0724-20121128/18678_1 /TAXON_ID=265536 /ORGANISM="Amphiprora sp., Strain CCMP467" /LENGTH=233 /DNA_ID=CAMNT_0008801271 /DNA_START=279 /DNA_END=980 /DNA_ORIENTATION=-